MGKNTPCYASAPEGRKQTPVTGFNLTWRNRPYLSQHHHSLSWGSITPFHQEYTSYCVGPTWVLLGVNVRKYTSETGCIFPSLFFSSQKFVHVALILMLMLTYPQYFNLFQVSERINSCKIGLCASRVYNEKVCSWKYQLSICFGIFFSINEWYMFQKITSDYSNKLITIFYTIGKIN